MKSHFQQIDLSALCVGSVFYASSKENYHLTYGVFESEFGNVVIGMFNRQMAVFEFGDEPEYHKNLSYERDDELVAELIKEKVDLLFIGTPFQQNVWDALLGIQKGDKISYSGLAASMGLPTATRAVASAVARNRISYLVPCHRIVPIGGGVGNYHWGADLKKKILNVESAIESLGE